jgi:hypothetical protein
MAITTAPGAITAAVRLQGERVVVHLPNGTTREVSATSGVLTTMTLGPPRSRKSARRMVPR